MEHSLDIRIYYEDTDAGGVVYHANYLNFAERGRTEWLRALGHQNSDLRGEYGVIFVVKHVDIDYIKPAFLDDQLKLVTQVKTIKNSSLIMKQCVIRNGEKLTDMDVVLVCVDIKTLKPVRLPDILRSEFENTLDKTL